MDQTGISKSEAVKLLAEAGYDAYMEDGVVMVKWNDDPDLPVTLQKFLESHDYHSSFGIKGKASVSASLPDPATEDYENRVSGLYSD